MASETTFESRFLMRKREKNSIFSKKTSIPDFHVSATSEIVQIWFFLLHGFLLVVGGWICQNWYMDFSELLQGFVNMYTWISPSFYKYLLKLIHGFRFVMMWVCQSYSMFFRPLPNKTKLKFDQDFKGCWSFCFELVGLNES